MNFSSKSFFDFIKSNPSLQLQANFEFRWPLAFEENSYLIDTLEIPEIDSTQGYMYLDGYQIPVLGTPRFTNTIRVSFWAKEPFLNNGDSGYEIFFKELIKQRISQQQGKSEAYIIPCSTPPHTDRMRAIKTFHFYDVKLKQITVDEHSASSQALVHINLTLTFGAFDITFENKTVQNGMASNDIDDTEDRKEKNSADSVIVAMVNNASWAKPNMAQIQ